MTAPRRTTAGGERVLDDGGTRAVLADHPLGWLLRDASGPPSPAWVAELERWAREEVALDLRVAPADPSPWRAAGWEPLHAGSRELVRPVAVPLADAAATRALGERLAGVVRAGDLLVLSGPLGAGKTTLTSGLGAALGVRGTVTSPTFVLARVHRGPLPLVHVDAYRLRDAAGASGALDLDDLDLDAALEDAVTVVEWGEGLVEQLSDAHLSVRLARPVPGSETPSHVDGDETADGRTGTIRAYGPRWAVT